MSHHIFNSLFKMNFFSTDSDNFLCVCAKLSGVSFQCCFGQNCYRIWYDTWLVWWSHVLVWTCPLKVTCQILNSTERCLKTQSVENWEEPENRLTWLVKIMVSFPKNVLLEILVVSPKTWPVSPILICQLPSGMVCHGMKTFTRHWHHVLQLPSLQYYAPNTFLLT